MPEATDNPETEVVTVNDQTMEDATGRPGSPIEGPRQLNVMEDVDSTSIVPVVEQLIKSHIHKAAGACRWLEKDVVIWTDFSYQKFKKSFGVQEDLVPWQKPEGGIKGSYSLRTTPSEESSGWGGSLHLNYWGLAPALQSIRFEDDAILRQYGLNLGEMVNPFTKENKEPWPETGARLSYVVMKYQEISEEPKKSTLARFTSL